MAGPYNGAGIDPMTLLAMVPPGLWSPCCLDIIVPIQPIFECCLYFSRFYNLTTNYPRLHTSTPMFEHAFMLSTRVIFTFILLSSLVFTQSLFLFLFSQLSSLVRAALVGLSMVGTFLFGDQFPKLQGRVLTIE